MNYWKKLFSKKKVRVDQTSRPVSSGVDPSSKILLNIKRPRYAHMAKHHELHGEFSEADRNYNMLAEGQSQTLGPTHPDFASALYELAKLNHHHEIIHTPEIQMIYNTLGRGNQVHMFYQSALDIRRNALGENHRAYAQSLYGLATLYQDNQKADDAHTMLSQALKIQLNVYDPLPTALTMFSLAEVNVDRGDSARAIQLYQDSLQLLTFNSKTLADLEMANKYSKEAEATENNYEAFAKLTNKAVELQKNLNDPYFEMTFEFFVNSDAHLMLMVLELHRQQYIQDFRAARLKTLKRLAEAYRASGNPAAAIPLLQEAAELQQSTT